MWYAYRGLLQTKIKLALQGKALFFKEERDYGDVTTFVCVMDLEGSILMEERAVADGRKFEGVALLPFCSPGFVMRFCVIGQVFSSVVCVTCMQGQWICKDCPKICNGLEKAIISMN